MLKMFLHNWLVKTLKNIQKKLLSNYVLIKIPISFQGLFDIPENSCIWYQKYNYLTLHYCSLNIHKGYLEIWQNAHSSKLFNVFAFKINGNFFKQCNIWIEHKRWKTTKVFLK